MHLLATASKQMPGIVGISFICLVTGDACFASHHITHTPLQPDTPQSARPQHDRQVKLGLKVSVTLLYLKFEKKTCKAIYNIFVCEFVLIFWTK